VLVVAAEEALAEAAWLLEASLLAASLSTDPTEAHLALVEFPWEESPLEAWEVAAWAAAAWAAESEVASEAELTRASVSEEVASEAAWAEAWAAESTRASESVPTEEAWEEEPVAALPAMRSVEATPAAACNHLSWEAAAASRLAESKLAASLFTDPTEALLALVEFPWVAQWPPEVVAWVEAEASTLPSTLAELQPFPHLPSVAVLAAALVVDSTAGLAAAWEAATAAEAAPVTTEALLAAAALPQISRPALPALNNFELHFSFINCVESDSSKNLKSIPICFERSFFSEAIVEIKA